MIPFPSHVRGLIFDCDGTLVDSMPLHRLLWHEGLKRHGVTLAEGFVDNHAGKPTEEIVEIVNREYGVTIDPVAFAQEKERGFLDRVGQLNPVEAVVATARKHLGKLPMAVVSGSMREGVDGGLHAIGAIEWFPIVLTADDPIAPKPAPDLFLEAARLLGLAPEDCHVFEDGDSGIHGALAAGMTVTDVREVVIAS